MNGKYGKFCLLFCLTLISPGKAAEHSDLTSRCGRRVPEKFTADIVNLEPWFGECEQRIRRVGYEKQRDLFRYEYISCFLVPSKSGQIEELKIYKSSGTESLDGKCLSFITKSLPLPKAANDLPHERGVLVEFLGYPEVNVRLFSPRDKAVSRKGP